MVRFQPSSFNRTIVELKRLRATAIVGMIATFNRTIVELKRLDFDLAVNLDAAFNRTIVELKLYSVCKVFDDLASF